MAKKRPRRAHKKRAFFRRRDNRPDLMIRPSPLGLGIAGYGQGMPLAGQILPMIGQMPLAGQIRLMIGQMHRKQPR